MHSFNTKFGSRQVERASQDAFSEVVKQCGNHNKKRGAIFCQLQHDGSRFLLTGTYLPPKWADKVNKVLRDYKEELLQEQEDDIPF